MKDVEEMFLQLEKQLMYYRTEDFKQLLSEDFMEFGNSGMVFDKESQLSYVTEQGIPEIQMDLLEFNVKLLAVDVAHVTYISITKDEHQQVLRSSIWKNEHGNWRMVFHQGTRMAKKD